MRESGVLELSSTKRVVHYSMSAPVSPETIGWRIAIVSGRLPPANREEGAMEQLCDDLSQFAIQVRQLGYSLGGGVGERQCLHLSERMLAAVKQAEARVKQAEARMAGAKSTPLFRLSEPAGLTTPRTSFSGADPRRC